MRPRAKLTLGLVVAGVVIAGVWLYSTRGTSTNGNAANSRTIVVADHDWVGGALPGRGESYGSVFLEPVCLDRPGVAEIQSVEAIRPTGSAAVTDFSVFALRSGVTGAAPRRLAEVADFQGTPKVTQACKPDARAAEGLAVELHKPGNVNATANGFRVVYRTGSIEKELLIRYRVTLCERFESPVCIA